MLEYSRDMVDIHPKRVYKRMTEDTRQNQEDLVNMECLNDAEVLFNLKQRYKNN